MATRISPLAGKPAPPSSLVDIAKLVTAYYSEVPDPSVPAQRVAFGTVGPSRLVVRPVVQRAARARDHAGDLPLPQGAGSTGRSSSASTHALSRPASATALEVLAANGVDVMLATNDEYTPTPAVSHAILTYNRGRTTGWPTASS